MNQGVMFPGSMLVDLRICPGVEARLIKVSVRSLADGDVTPRPGARWRARDAVPIFVAAVDAGLFFGAKEGERASVLNANTTTNDKGERIDEWEIMTPALDVEALAVLARMFWTAGARGLAIVQNAPEPRLSVRSFDHAPRTDRIAQWEVVKPAAEDLKDAVIVVRFRAEVPPEVARATQDTLEAWAAVVAFGGFSGSAAPSSSAVLSEVGVELETEVFASFEGLQLGRDGWAALWAGLSRIHKDAPIQRVEMR